MSVAPAHDVDPAAFAIWPDFARDKTWLVFGEGVYTAYRGQKIGLRDASFLAKFSDFYNGSHLALAIGRGAPGHAQRKKNLEDYQLSLADFDRKVMDEMGITRFGGAKS